MKMRNIVATAIAASTIGTMAVAAPALPTTTTTTTTEYSPSAFVGVSFAFGGGASSVGFSTRILSSNKPNEVVGAVGVTFYPWSDDMFGIDLGLGYVGDEFVGTASYDFIQKAPIFSLGVAQKPKEVTLDTPTVTPRP